MPGLLDRHRIEPVFAQGQQAGAGIGHQDRGVRRHDHLALAEPVHAAQQLEEFDLAGRRQRRFRLVEDEDAAPLAAFLEDAQKTLAMRMGEEIGAVRAADAVEIARHREEALGPEEPAIGDFRQPARPERTGKRAAHGLDRLGMIDRAIALAAAGLVIAGEHGDAFEQRRFSGAVLADDDGDRPVEGELEFLAQEGQAPGIGVGVRHGVAVEPDAPEIRRGQVGLGSSHRGSRAGWGSQ